MDFLDKQISAPASWDKFEDLARSLFGAVYRNPLAQKNGRRGQPQHGVDVFVERVDKPGAWIGIQCKGKDQGYGSKATRVEFDAELEKAGNFRPALDQWIFATTAPNDEKLQEHAREVSSARVEQRKFPVNVLGWDSLRALIAQHPEVIKEFYPEHLSPVPSEVEILARESSEALDAIDDTLCHGSVRITLLRSEHWDAARSALESDGIVRLNGEGGAGKSGILRRLGMRFQGPVLVIKDNRVLEANLSQHLAQLGIRSSAIELLDAIAQDKPALCLVDGADRLLLSERRSLVLDLLRAISSCRTSKQWRIATSARSLQGRDLVADALVEVGIEKIGTAVQIGALSDEDIEALRAAYPSFRPLLAREDLSGQNRSLFLLRELLSRVAPPTVALTELDIADAWATGLLLEPVRAAQRSTALAQIGAQLVAIPWRLPGRSQLDAAGLQTLVLEGAVSQLPNCDVLRLTYDVHEDWLLARHLYGVRDEAPDVLRRADQPLWWLRAVRLTAQLLLERGDQAGWRALLSRVEAAADLDPAWSRSILVAPLYSERSPAILAQLEQMLLDADARLLSQLLETLIVFETRLNERVLGLARLADRDETTRYAVAAYLKIPVFRSWGAFLRWSLPKWPQWPLALIPKLVELAAIFTSATAGVANPLSRDIAKQVHEWLVEIEDAHHAHNWEDRREPFNTKLPDYRAWEVVEERSRAVLVSAIELGSEPHGGLFGLACATSSFASRSNQTARIAGACAFSASGRMDGYVPRTICPTKTPSPAQLSIRVRTVLIPRLQHSWNRR